MLSILRLIRTGRLCSSPNRFCSKGASQPLIAKYSFYKVQNHKNEIKSTNLSML